MFPDLKQVKSWTVDNFHIYSCTDMSPPDPLILKRGQVVTGATTAGKCHISNRSGM